ncbi:VOC family protein, partial [Alkalibacterium sp.]
MKRIVPNFWFDKEAEEAATFYTSLFENSRVTSTQVLEDTPSGTTT